MGLKNSTELPIDELAEAVERKMIAWRRDIHEHPELGNQEVRTSKLVADHLRGLNFDEVRTGLGGGTGIVGILRGPRPGPVVGLRADMDALPVKEETDVPFASKARTTWGAQDVPVMHACGHDAHTAILMATAEVLVRLRDDLAGTVVLLFQPAEEGAAPDWVGPSGAELMLKEGALADPKPDALFGLHVWQGGPRGKAGEITYHTGAGTYAMSVFRLTIEGKGGHAALPWLTVDPIVAASQVVLALQTIPSRNVDVNNNHVTLSLGMIQGGDKFNVIPDKVVIEGALRHTDADSRTALEHRLETIASAIAQAAGARANVQWVMRVPILYNDPKLVERMKGSFVKATGNGDKVVPVTNFFLDDFSHFSTVIPSLFIGLNITPPVDHPREVGGHHAPNFWINEDALITGLKAMVHMTCDYLAGDKAA